MPPKTDEAFLREVDEELRRDQLMTLWKRNGRLIIAAVIIGLATFGGVLWWRSADLEAAGREGETLQAAFDELGANQDKPAPAAIATIAKSSREGYRALAIFVEADLLLKKNDLKGAAAKFAIVANDTSMGQPFRDLALVRQTAAEFDSLKPQDVITRLKPLAVKDNAWFASAGELVAAAHLKMNRPDLAGPIFAQIAKDEKAPASLRQRAVQMAGVLGIDAIDTPQDKKAG